MQEHRYTATRCTEKGFYVFNMNIRKESGNIDTVPVMVSERMCNIEDIKVGKMYEVVGQFRSYNRHEEKKNRLIPLCLP